MMLICKIGQQYFGSLDNEDRNSGLYEYDLINSEFTNEEKNEEKIFIIIGGLPTPDDVERIKIMDDYMTKLHGKKYKKVFIMSDSICFKSCKEIYESCDLVLHQIPKGGFPGMQQKNLYGYVPELFFKDRPKIANKSNIILFGGNNLNRQKEFDKYLFDSQGNVNDSILLLHKDYDAKIDNRLPYNYYIRLMSLVKYALIIARKEYYDLGWVTSRIVEAYDNYVLPLVDIAYDKYYHFKITTFVKDYNDIISTLQKDVYDFEYCQKIIEENRDRIREDRKKFREVILNV